MNLPKPIADFLCHKSSRLAHLYGLPKTHKRVLSMRPILSATDTYNFQLAKWLDEKLKPLSTNGHPIEDIFQFADVIQQTPVKDDDVLVSYDVTALFTNIPVDETIQIPADKAFRNDWFKKTYGLQLKKEQLIELLEVAVKDHQHFQFDGFTPRTPTSKHVYVFLRGEITRRRPNAQLLQTICRRHTFLLS